MFFAAALSVCHFLSMSTDCLCILGSSNANDIVINSADGSTSCFQSTTLNCCFQFTNCSQICVDGTSQVPPADSLFYSKQNKEVTIESGNYLWERNAVENRMNYSSKLVLSTLDTRCITQGSASFKMYIRYTALYAESEALFECKWRRTQIDLQLC